MERKLVVLYWVIVVLLGFTFFYSFSHTKLIKTIFPLRYEMYSSISKNDYKITFEYFNAKNKNPYRIINYSDTLYLKLFQFNKSHSKYYHLNESYNDCLLFLTQKFYNIYYHHYHLDKGHQQSVLLARDSIAKSKESFYAKGLLELAKSYKKKEDLKVKIRVYSKKIKDSIFNKHQDYSTYLSDFYLIKDSIVYE